MISADEKGLSLLEIIVALMVFSIVIAGIMLSLQTGATVQGRSDLQTKAIHLAQEQMEEYKAKSFAQLKDCLDDAPVIDYPQPGVERTVVVKPGDNDRLIIIEITVTWGGETYVLANQKADAEDEEG